MSIAETPIAAIRGATDLDRRRRPSGRAPLPARASGSTPTCTARRNWSMPPAAPCRSRRRRAAGWCRRTARSGCRRCSEHAIDVLADIEMRTLYFDLAWLRREAAQRQPRCRIRGAGVAAAAPGDPGAVRRPQRSRPHRASDQARHAGTASGRGFRDLHSAAARAALPPRRRHRARRSHRQPRDRDAGARGRHLGADAVAAVLFGDATELQELVPARPHRGCDRKTVDRQPMSRSSNSPPTSATPACRRFRMPSGRSPARRRRSLRRRNDGGGKRSRQCGRERGQRNSESQSAVIASAAKQSSFCETARSWIASSQALLAMTA